MGNKKHRQERLMRVPTAQPAFVAVESGLRVVQKLTDHVALMSDGSIHLDTFNLGTPADTYDADFAWVDFRLGSVRLSFGQEGSPGRLYTCLQVKFSPEAFRHHFWENSRDFHSLLKKRAAARGQLIDRTRDDLRPEALEPEKRHTISANFDVMAQTGNEAQVDFFHLPPSGIANWIRKKDGRGMKVSARVRVLVPTDELFRLLEQAETIMPKVDSLVKIKEIL